VGKRRAFEMEASLIEVEEEGGYREG